MTTTITWISAAHRPQAPLRRYASEHATDYAFADVRRSLANELAREGFGIDCLDAGKSQTNPLISAVFWLVAQWKSENFRRTIRTFEKRLVG